MIKPVTIIFLIAASVLAVTNYLAIELYLYWYYPWMDLLTHALGGAVVALGIFCLNDFWPRLPKRFQSFTSVMSFVVVVAVFWELFEIWAGISIGTPGYAVDTVLDLIMGLSGGLIGYFVGKSISDIDV